MKRRRKRDKASSLKRTIEVFLYIATSTESLTREISKICNDVRAQGVWGTIKTKSYMRFANVKGN